MQSDLVSVVISLYNKERQIVNTLKSLLVQSYDLWECIIVDDGSTDLSLTVLKDFIGGLTHSEKFVVLKQNNSGQSSARNRGIALAKGEFIAFLDADDIWNPNKLETQVRLLKESPESVMVIGAYSITQKGFPKRTVRHTSYESLLNDWLTLSGFGGAFESVALVRAESIKKEMFETSLSTSAGLEVFIRLSKERALIYSKRALFTYLKYPGQWHTNFNELERNLRLVYDIHFPEKQNELEENLRRYSSLVRLKGALKDFDLFSISKEIRPRNILFFTKKALKFLKSVVSGLFIEPKGSSLFSGKKSV